MKKMCGKSVIRDPSNSKSNQIKKRKPSDKSGSKPQKNGGGGKKLRNGSKGPVKQQ